MPSVGESIQSTATCRTIPSSFNKVKVDLFSPCFFDVLKKLRERTSERKASMVKLTNKFPFKVSAFDDANPEILIENLFVITRGFSLGTLSMFHSFEWNGDDWTSNEWKLIELTTRLIFHSFVLKCWASSPFESENQDIGEPGQNRTFHQLKDLSVITCPRGSIQVSPSTRFVLHLLGKIMSLK